jgi:hypothetical protein
MSTQDTEVSQAGVAAYDVPHGMQSRQVSVDGCPRIIRLSLAPFAGPPVDFAPGDPIEEAIGPDPFRSWLFEKASRVYPAPVVDVVNEGLHRPTIARQTAEGFKVQFQKPRAAGEVLR